MSERHTGAWHYHTYPLDWASLLHFGPKGLPWSKLALSFGFTCSFVLASFVRSKVVLATLKTPCPSLPEYEQHRPSTTSTELPEAQHLGAM